VLLSVQIAINSGSAATIEATKDDLDDLNNAGCPSDNDNDTDDDSDSDNDGPCDCPTLEELLKRSGKMAAPGKKIH
jgi:hypothetical protein